MKRKLFVLSAALLAVCLVSLELLALQPPEDMIQVTVPEGARLTKPRVQFSHAPHTGSFKCANCHHTWDGKSPMQKCVSSGCHDLANPKDTAEKAMPSYFRNAFHGQKRSCNYCHWTRRKAGKSAGPVVCKECHIQ